jgi:hypothetical protein
MTSMLAVLSGAALFVWLVDPYNRFGRGADIGRLGPSTNHVLQTMIEAARLPSGEIQKAGVVIIGDSRARGLTGGCLTKVGSASVLDLGIGGGSLEEMITSLQQCSTELNGMHLLIVTVPFERFAAKPLSNRAIEAEPVAHSMARYLLNAEMLRQSWVVFRQPRTDRPMHGPGKAIPKREADFAMVLKTWQRMYADYDHDRAQQRLADLREALAAIRRPNLKVIFWLPPLRGDVQQLILEAGLAEERRWLLESLRASGTVVDMTDWKGIGDEEFTFTDPVHTANGARILQLLIEAGTSPSNQPTHPQVAE